jgi:signal transduction histidine kinase
VKVKTKLENVYIMGNEVSLSELLTILLDNAIKYSHRGGEVCLKIKKVQKNVVIEVKDQGIGIRSSDIPFIFNRFYRADSSRSKEKVDGYGLGLSIAKAIVESFGGEIKVTSKIGEGSVFTVKLPSVS